MSSTQRDGTRSVLRRRSPRGTPRKCFREPARLAKQLAVLALDASESQRQLVAGGFAFVVGEERVVVHRCGEGALGETEHDDEVEIEADPHRDRTDEHTVAEASDPTEIRFELERQRAGEHVEAHRAFDRVERGESIERGLDAVGGLPLAVGPTVAAVRRTDDRSELVACPA